MSETQRLYREPTQAAPCVALAVVASEHSRERWLDANATVSRRLVADATGDPLRLVADTLRFATDAGCVALLATPRDGGRPQALLCVGPRSEEVAAQLLTEAPSLPQHVARTGEPLLVQGIRGAPGPDRLAAASLLVLPLPEVDGHRAVFVAVRFADQPHFTLADLASAAGFAHHAGALAELSAARAEQQHCETLALRERIAGELQGGIGRQLFSVGLALNGVSAGLGTGPLADRVAAATLDLDRVIAQVRATALDMAVPRSPRRARPPARLLAVVAEFAPTLGFEPTLSLSGQNRDTTAFDEVLDDAVAALGDALANVARHGLADSVTVTVDMTDAHLTIDVSDDSGREPAGTRLSWSIPTP